MTDYMKTIRACIDEWKKSSEPYDEYLRRKFSAYKYICVFGLGNIGLPTVQILLEKNINIDFLCDNDSEKWGKEYYGIKCISLDELKQNMNDTLVIICGRAFEEIYRQLEEEGFKHLYRLYTNKFAIYEYFSTCDMGEIVGKIERVLGFCKDEESRRIYTRILTEWFNKDYAHGGLNDICTDDQYFCRDIIEINEDEIFVDAGAYNGDTLRFFLEVAGDRFEKYYCFELAERNYKSLCMYIAQLEEETKSKIIAINKGLSDCEQEILYTDSDEGSRVDGAGDTKGHVTSIDQEIVGKVTYIKMDIEGSELEALKGARESIKTYKPKLAICLYHKPQDMWEIPLYIKSLVPEYEIYIRHHTDLLNETVCYALID